MNEDRVYKTLMRKCINIAKQAKGENLPNPYVGAIVYCEDTNSIISEGYHKKYGLEHAEVNAINKALGNTKNKTLIVNLEPCSHQGKTPPCADLIIKSGFKKVVVGMVDVNPIVQGRGIKKLQQAGIEVVVGVLEEECRKLNKIFIKNIEQKKPYIMLKTAATLDSRIADYKEESKWITNELSRNHVQKLRSSYCAIMTGSGTVLKDNPRLNVRLKNKKSPTRIIFDPNNKIPIIDNKINYNIFNNDNTRIILINNSNINLPKHIEQISFNGDFGELLKELYKKNIYSIMIEAGRGLNSQFLKNKEVDEINYYIAPKILGAGVSFVDINNYFDINNNIQLDNVKIKQFYNDVLINARIKK